MIADKYYQMVLSSLASKAKETEILSAFKLVYRAEGEIQNFLNGYAGQCNVPNVFELFKTPVQWKSIVLDCSYKFKITFDALDFEAVLKQINVSRKFKNGIEEYVYTLCFEKSVDTDIDPIFAFFLNQKETDENGRKKAVLFDVSFEALEVVR